MLTFVTPHENMQRALSRGFLGAAAPDLGQVLALNSVCPEQFETAKAGNAAGQA